MSQPSKNPPPTTLPYHELDATQQHQRLRELALIFLKLGAIAFGGPAAHIAMMNTEFVQRRQWFTQEKVLDLLGVTNLIPGPNSTELAIHIGYERGGWKGLVIAGSCFILPAMSIVWILAVLYQRYQTLPQVGWLLYGVKPVIIAIILQALWKLGKSAAKDLPTIATGIAVIVLSLLQVDQIVLLILAGVTVLLLQHWRRFTGTRAAWLFPLTSYLAQATATPTVTPNVTPNVTLTAAATAPAPTWLSVFLIFLKIGSVLYGSGYVLLAFLQQEFVDRAQWLTSQQLLDAVAIGQFTPGPVFTTATFIGYLLAGNAGAIAGTVGIFLPAFVLVLIVNPWVPKLRQSIWVSSFLDGVNAASLGLMAVVTWELGQAALIDWLTITLAILSAIAVFRFRVNSAWLVLAGGAIGWGVRSLGITN